MQTPPQREPLAGRFLISHLAGSGGSGSIYRAFDLVEQRPVAVKLLHPRGSQDRQRARLLCEAQYLRALQHPGIVSYVAHGQAADGSTYLVMEWLEGEDLSRRLECGPLGIAECLALLGRAVEALAAVHTRGITHRDLKPSNLFLRDGKLEKLALLDFGLARGLSLPAPGDSGAPVVPERSPASLSGSPAYLAPEVIALNTESARELTPAADIFSLGSVIYECLTGVSPFRGSSVTATLARILFDEPLPPRQQRPDTPAALEALVLRMLSKDPKQRPCDAAALQAELKVLAQSELAPPGETQKLSVLTTGEQRFVTVLLGVLPPEENGAEGAGTPGGFRAAVQQALAESGAQLEQLTERQLVVAFPHAATAEALDTAEKAARSALRIKERWPAAQLAVATGRSQFPQRMPTGEVLASAASLLAAAPAGSGQVLSDELTGDLVGARLGVVALGGGAFALSGSPEEPERAYRLLGQPTPCVGREPESALLEEAFEAAVTWRSARAVLVIGPPGAGKSRLWHEFWRRRRAESPPPGLLLLRGDQIGTALPFGLIGRLLSQLLGLQGGEPLALKQARLLARLGERGLGSEAQSTAEMLGELCGVPFPDENSAPLRTARQDPRVLMEQVSRAWVNLLAAECARRPLVLAVEDLHWADSLSVTLIGTALRELADQPLFLLALARPTVESTFPQLWRESEPQILRLGSLSRRACERLARHVLGEQASPELIARITELSSGNPLCLEELIRSAAHHKRADVPPTVVLMLQARLLRLPLEPRRALRAASLFGEVFWSGGVRALLGPQTGAAGLDPLLRFLIQDELIERQPESRIAGEQEFRFRHCLIRDAAYGLFTDSDLELGHRIAADFLESAGERDPLILADHLRKGGAPARALPYYIAAAEQALRGSDIEGALGYADQAQSCGPSGEALGNLYCLRLAAHFWRDRWTEAFPAGTEALRLLQPGSTGWCRAAAIMAPITPLLGRDAEFAALAQTLAQVEPSAEARPAYVHAAAYVMVMLSLTGQVGPARAFQKLVQKQGAALLTQDLALVGIILFAETVFERMLGRDPYRAWQLSAEGAAASERAADSRNLLFIKAFEGISLADLGDHAGAWAVLQSAAGLAARLREPLLQAHVRIHIEQLQLVRGSAADTEATYSSARQSVEEAGINPLLRGQSLINLARAQLLRGEPEAALATGRKAAGLLAGTPAHLIYLGATLIECLLALGCTAEAADEARSGLRRRAELGSGGYGEVEFLRAAAGALAAAGQDEDAARVRLEVQEQITRRAERIPDPQVRARYLAHA